MIIQFFGSLLYLYFIITFLCLIYSSFVVITNFCYREKECCDYYITSVDFTHLCSGEVLLLQQNCNNDK